jgi:hypothetical protein
MTRLARGQQGWMFGTQFNSIQYSIIEMATTTAVLQRQNKPTASFVAFFVERSTSEQTAFCLGFVYQLFVG